MSWNFLQRVMECQGKVREFESCQSVGTLYMEGVVDAHGSIIKI